MQSGGNGGEHGPRNDVGDDDFATPANRISGTIHGDSVQAGTVHGGVHFHQAPGRSPIAPSQLPPARTVFIDRSQEIGLLQEDAHAVAEQRESRVTVLIGTGGVGKTALATAFLRSAATGFPDGQLYADLGGFSPSGPTDPAQILDALLRSLGAAPAEIPEGLSARSSLFRTWTTDRRLAFLFDDAFSAAQVRALLPGQGAHLVLATTRLQLSGLVSAGARFIDVRPMDEDAAAELLVALIGGRRDDVGDRVSKELAELCGRLPLAVCAAAGRLVMRPARPVRQMVDELSSEQRRLAALSRYGQDEDGSVRAVFDVSYRALPDRAARLYRLLGLHPGPRFGVLAAAALADTDTYDADEQLDYLVEASMLEDEGEGGYSFHDLVRIHAHDRAEDEEDAREREAALDRLVERYLVTAVSADLILNPGRWHLSALFGQAKERPPAFAGRDAALAWFEAELPNLRELVLFCTRTGRNKAAWQLCEGLWAYFTLTKPFDAWLATHRSGLASAEALGDLAAQARMLAALGSALLALGSIDQAAGLHRRALDLWRSVGHGLGQASALEELGNAELARGRPEAATARYLPARDLFAELAVPRGVAMMERHLGEAERDAGRPDAAIPHFQRARAYFAEQGDGYQEARAVIGLATTRLAECRFDQAADVLAEALDITTRSSAHFETARVRALLADAELGRGRPAEARVQLAEAHAIYSGLRAPQAAEVARRLAELE
ncbi:tetratricopeptide repeat protein [Nocardiopsis sediminis]|uniref:Tetratricopeptide repeat protein n=1 Tax=Nocardiopsis sediminis TaxID=1778267 RepID=A0ABV8FQG5_9ACTN